MGLIERYPISHHFIVHNILTEFLLKSNSGRTGALFPTAHRMGRERGMRMDQEKKMLMQKYDHVWQRVRPDVDPFAVLAEREVSAAVPREKAGEEWILEKIAHEESDRAYYLTLARRGAKTK